MVTPLAGPPSSSLYSSPSALSYTSYYYPPIIPEAAALIMRPLPPVVSPLSWNPATPPLLQLSPPPLILALW